MTTLLKLLLVLVFVQPQLEACLVLKRRQAAQLRHLPPHGKWLSWSDWQPSCHHRWSCDSRQTQTRWRSCRGLHCRGPAVDERICQQTGNCSTVAALGRWSSWQQSCSRSCGVGIQFRFRKCLSTAKWRCSAQFLNQSRVCNLRDCDERVNQSSWTSWSACDVTCGRGRQHRELRHGNSSSPASSKLQLQTRACANGRLCPVAGQLAIDDAQNNPRELIRCGPFSRWSMERLGELDAVFSQLRQRSTAAQSDVRQTLGTARRCLLRGPQFAYQDVYRCVVRCRRHVEQLGRVFGTRVPA